MDDKLVQGKLNNVQVAFKAVTENMPYGTAIVGSKVWVKNLVGATGVAWIYSLQNTGVALHRIRT